MRNFLSCLNVTSGRTNKSIQDTESELKIYTHEIIFKRDIQEISA